MIEYNKSKNRNVLDVRESLKVGLQMEQGKKSISLDILIDIEPCNQDMVVVHVGDLMIFTSLWVS